MKQSRREFVRTIGTAGAGLMVPSLNVLGANEDVRIAICGVRGKGNQHAKRFRKMKGVRLVALCDPDQAVLDRRLRPFRKDPRKGKVDGHIDFREVLDRKDIDAVCIATPNHWHALMSVYACQAGKDVYVEKPVSHTLWEGRKIVEAARKYKRIVQAGTQNRSDVGLRELYPWLGEGHIGKVKMVRGLCYRNRHGIGKRDTPLKPPATVNYNLWLGPAQDLPIYRPRFHYDWHWVWNTGDGGIGNQGPHEMDLIRWALGDRSLPTRVISFGGRFAWNDAGETPNMLFTAFEYDDVPVFFEVRHLQIRPGRRAMPHYRGCRVGVIITCEGGWFRGGRGGGWVYDNKGKKMKQFKGDGGGRHQANFIKAVRSRKASDLHAPIEKGHLSACLLHMANISYRIGTHVSPETLRERMGDDREGLDAIGRYSDQLAAWGVDLKKTPWTLGVSLGFDPEKERFVGVGPLVAQANGMLHRKYRAPFVVPQEV